MTTVRQKTSLKTFVALFDLLQKDCISNTSQSVFAKYAKTHFGVIAREFRAKEEAILYIKHFMAAKDSYATEREDAQLAWSQLSVNVKNRFSIQLKECSAKSIKYYLFFTKNGVHTATYECKTHTAAIDQAHRLLSNNELEATKEEDNNGYWCGIADSGNQVVLELRLYFKGNPNEQYLTIDPYECLTKKERALFLDAPTETKTRKQSIGMAVTYAIALAIELVIFIHGWASGTSTGNLPIIFILPTVLLLINSLRK